MIIMKNFLIVGTQRTGSSAFAESIGLHPSVTCGWEWVNHVYGKRKIMVAERALAGDWTVIKTNNPQRAHDLFNSAGIWLGFRWLFRANNKWLIRPSFCPSLYLDGLEPQIRWLGRRPDIHIIHLVRRDGLDWLKSKFLSRETKSYYGKKYPESIRITIPVREAVKRLQAKNWIDKRLSTLMDTNPYHKVFYEDYLYNEAETTGAALRFLHCDPKDIIQKKRRIQRQSTENASNYIINYDELIDTLTQHNLLIAN